MDPREKLLSTLRQQPHLVTLEENDRSFQADLGRNATATFGLTVQLSLWGSGKYQILFWFDHLSVHQAPLFSQKPMGIFYRETSVSDPQGSNSRGHFLITAFLKLINNASLLRLIQLDFREWDSFLREKNSQPLVENTELWKEIFMDLKTQIITQLAQRYLSVKDLSFYRQNPESLNYQQKNLFLVDVVNAFQMLFPAENYPLEAVEATDEGYLVKWKRKLSESEELVFHQLLSKNSPNGALFPVKLVAVN